MTSKSASTRAAEPQSRAVDPLTRFEVVRPRRIGEYIAAAIVLLVVAWMTRSVVVNPNFEWHSVGEYLFNRQIMDGLVVTLELTAVAMGIAIVLGALLAVMRMSRNRVLVGLSWGYAWLMRGIPLMVQLVFWFNLGALYPKLSIGIPFGPEFVSRDASAVITGWTAAVLGLGLHEAAYMAEIIRGGIGAVDRGQVEGATALGMTHRQTMWRIVLPQALRVITPPTGNQIIGMTKMTSLVSVLALSDLLYAAQLIYARSLQPIPLLIVVVVWYLVLTSVLMVGQYFLERWISRSERGKSQPPPGSSTIDAGYGVPGAGTVENV